MPATTRSTTAVLPVPPAAIRDHTRSGEVRSETHAPRSRTSSSSIKMWRGLKRMDDADLAAVPGASGCSRWLTIDRSSRGCAQGDSDLLSQVVRGGERIADEGGAQPDLEVDQSLDTGRDLRDT